MKIPDAGPSRFNSIYPLSRKQHAASPKRILGNRIILLNPEYPINLHGRSPMNCSNPHQVSLGWKWSTMACQRSTRQCPSKAWKFFLGLPQKTMVPRFVQIMSSGWNCKNYPAETLDFAGKMKIPHTSTFFWRRKLKLKIADPSWIFSQATTGRISFGCYKLEIVL